MLHFYSNALQKNPGEVGYNCLFKLQPIIYHFRHVFSTSVIPETMLAADEMMVAFKGRHKLKVYMPAKPTKLGYKLCSLSGVSGYVILRLASMIEKELLLVRKQLKVKVKVDT